MDGRSFRKISRRMLVDMIEPRVEEIFGLVAEKLHDSGYADRVVPGGVILTGGGALLKGIEQSSDKILQLTTRIGLPQGVLGPSEVIGHPSFATAIGLLHFQPRDSHGANASSRRRARTGSWVTRMKDWVEQTF